jgi:S-formylglutathione hydrolase FrmB
MALAEIRFFGNSISLATAMNVLIPDNIPGPLPVFYLLHGLSDDHSIWLRHTSLERYAARIPMLIVMPTTARAWYTNSSADPKRAYEDHIIKDVIPFIDRTFPTNKKREARAIGGLSMGGYGAIKLALKHPHLFASANSHSGALAPFRPTAAERSDNLGSPEFTNIFGPSPRGSDNDPLALATKCPKNLRPKLRIDCGATDHLLNQSREFHTHLNSLNYPHDYEELPRTPPPPPPRPPNPRPPGHDWNYWDYTIQQALTFHCKNLNIQLPTEKAATSKKSPKPKSKPKK